MVKTEYDKCPICGVEITGYGIEDLNNNMNAHLATVHNKYPGDLIKEEPIKEEVIKKPKVKKERVKKPKIKKEIKKNIFKRK